MHEAARDSPDDYSQVTTSYALKVMLPLANSNDMQCGAVVALVRMGAPCFVCVRIQQHSGKSNIPLTGAPHTPTRR